MFCRKNYSFKYDLQCEWGSSTAVLNNMNEQYLFRSGQSYYNQIKHYKLYCQMKSTKRLYAADTSVSAALVSSIYFYSR